MARGKLLTEEQKVLIRHRIAAGQTDNDIARAMDVNSSSVHYLRSRIAEARDAREDSEETKSLKDLLLRTVAEQGPIPTVPDLLHRARGGGGRDNFGAHEVTHILYSLNKQGYVKFGTDKRKASGAQGEHLINIEATARGYGKAGFGSGPAAARRERARAAAAEERANLARSGPVEQVRPPDPKPDPVPEPEPVPSEPEWPLLEALLEKEAHRVAGLAAYEAAIAALDGVAGLDIINTLKGRASIVASSISQIEHEYMRYAEAHP